jgi:hypothetical protein
MLAIRGRWCERLLRKLRGGIMRRFCGDTPNASGPKLDRCVEVIAGNAGPRAAF